MIRQNRGKQTKNSVLEFPRQKNNYLRVYHWKQWEAAWWIGSKVDESKFGSTASFTRCWAEEPHKVNGRIK